MTDIERLAKVIDEAHAALVSAEQSVSFARSKHTDALNRYNQACKDLDELIASYKKQAPRDTDWFREMHPPRMERVEG